MKLIHKVYFVIFATSIFINANTMSHNWPHYKASMGPEICTCAHMEAIIDYFKDKKDLTMVLGAGDRDDNYKRFENYTFVVCEGYYNVSKKINPTDSFGMHIFRDPSSKKLEKLIIDETLQKLQQQLKKDPREPLLIPLDYNSQFFANFLDKFTNKFKEIIFDYQSADYTKDWDGPNKIIEKIFNSLQNGGEFYSEHVFEIAFSPLPADVKFMRKGKGSSPDLFIKTTGKQANQNDGREFIVNSLKNAGFVSEIRNDKTLFLKQKLGSLPGGVIGDEYYIYAKKSASLGKILRELKDSLTQLKTKLQSLNAKLNGLSSKLESKSPMQSKKISNPKTSDWISGTGQQWTFNITQDQLKLETRLGVYAQVPGIGIYADSYVFRKRIFLLELSDSMLKNAPQIILDQIKGRNVFFYINIVGIKAFDIGVSSEDLYSHKDFNIVFHGFLALDKGPGDFKQNVKMGIFEPDGIAQATSSSISFGSLAEADVHYHAPCFSPNNARFKVESNREISTFWSVALSPISNNAAVTYHLLINNVKLEDELTKILNGDSFETILQQLENFTPIPENDARTLKNFVATINKLRKI
jgi:hypothetical protein